MMNLSYTDIIKCVYIIHNLIDDIDAESTDYNEL